MATPLEQANYGDQFVSKMDELKPIITQLITRANNWEMFPDIVDELLANLTSVQEQLKAVRRSVAISTYEARRLSG